MKYWPFCFLPVLLSVNLSYGQKVSLEGECWDYVIVVKVLSVAEYEIERQFHKDQWGLCEGEEDAYFLAEKPDGSEDLLNCDLNWFLVPPFQVEFDFN